MADVDVAYNEDQAPLEALLRSIDRPGNYSTEGRLFVPMPRVEVEGAGSLSFPITVQQARALTAAAEPAPYGRGEQTLVDPSVRACRQIDAARCAWPAAHGAAPWSRSSTAPPPDSAARPSAPARICTSC